MGADIRWLHQASHENTRSQSGTEVNDRELLRLAAYALREFSLRALSVKSFLDVPYRDMPSLTPWTRTIEPEARRAHDLAMTIRKHLGER